MSWTRPALCEGASAPVTDRPGVGQVVGRDPAGSTWRVLRGAAGLTPAEGPPPELSLDPLRGCLELAPAALGQELQATLRRPPPLETLEAPDGALYRSDPDQQRVLRRRPADMGWAALPGFGGFGRALGRLDGPWGLGWDPRGFLLVTDAGNHRVQVIRPVDGSVLDALGTRDAHGGSCAGVDGGAMQEPVDVDVDPRSGRIYVADRRGGRVHVFSPSFTWLRSFTPEPAAARPEGGRAVPLAVAVMGDGSLLVADATLPLLLRFSPEGELLGEPALHTVDHGHLRTLQLRHAFAPQGSVVLGPIDSGRPDTAWHELGLECAVPAGCAVTLRSWATDDPSAAPNPARWAPENPVPIGLTENPSAETRRLILSDWSAWRAWHEGGRQGSPPRGTDRGRYLWVQLELRGRVARPGASVARATPSVYALRAVFPRPSLLQHLPARWSRRDDADPSGALFAERLLTLFEGALTDAERRLEDLPRLLNLDAAPAEWLDWIATWLDLAFDPSWPVERRRGLVREAMALYQRRGTPAGLARYVELYTGQRPVIVEGFQLRGAASPTDAGAHRFTLYVYVPDARERDLILSVVRRIVDSEKPAHAACALRPVTPDARVGLQSTVGLDLMLGHGLQAERPLCATPEGALNAPALGSSPRLGGLPGPRLDDAGVPIDHTLRLT